MEDLNSIRVEKHVLGGLIKDPKLMLEICGFVNSEDFYVPIHKVIFGVIQNLVFTQKEADKVLIAQKIKELGISFKDDVNIFDYIESLSSTQINKLGTIEASKELVRLRIKRDFCKTAEDIKDYIKKSKDAPIEEIIASAHSLFNSNIRALNFSDEPTDLMEGIPSLIEERGNNPMDEVGLPTHYPEFNRLYGGLRNGNLYAIVSRPAQGKTTFISDLCFGVARLSMYRVPILILDTEMKTYDIQFRIASSLTGIPMWYLESGNWRKNKEMFDIVRAAFKEVKKFHIYHLHVANKNVDEIASIARRWYYTKIGKGRQVVIGYDYLKLTGEKVGNNWAEHQAIGEKIDKFKRLSEELDCPIFTAMQMNRSGENFNKDSKDVTDDASAIALSDRLQWFASFVAIFRRKTLDEIEADGTEFGTHKLIPTKTRFQGKEAAGHIDMFARPLPDGKKRYVNNYINFEVKNFKVTEKGSLKDVIHKLEMKYDFDKNHEKDVTLA
jgi:replicative DNA helicase